MFVMLVSFKVANFLSFKEMQEFSMVAGDYSNHIDHVIKGKVNLIDRAAIFGPNSSGKSNFVYAMAYAQELVKWKEVRNSTTIKIFDKMNYQGGSESKTESYFEFQILLEGKVYSYGFEYDTLYKMFVSEWLSELKEDGSERMIFGLGFLPEYTHQSDNQDDDLLLQDHGPLDGAFLLKSTSEESKQVALWIKHSLLVVTTLGDGARFNSTISDFKTEDIPLLLKQLARLDTGIDGIRADSGWGNIALECEYEGITHLSADELNWDKIWNEDPVDDSYSYYADKFNSSKYQISYPRLNLNSSRLMMSMDRKVDEDYLEQEGGNWDPPLTEEDLRESVPEDVGIHFTHKPSHFDINIADESEGTKRVLQILLLILGRPYDTRDCRTLVFDEFECSIHVLLVKELLNIYSETRQNSDRQLIITTHESRLLDNNVLRKDEVWFVDSSEDAGSSIYSIDSFVDPGEKDIDLEYLRGRFDAVPKIPDGIDERGDDE